MTGGVPRDSTRRSRDAPADGAQSQRTPKPSVDDFSGAAIDRAIRKQALEHPATIYPVVAGAGIGVAMTVMVGLSPLSLGLILGGLFVGGSAFIINYWVNGEARAARHVNQLREQLREAEQQEVVDLSHECDNAGFEEGARHARELTEAYRNLRNYLRETQSRSSGQQFENFRHLAEGTHREGAVVLREALEIFKALQTVDVDALQKEVQGWQKERKKLPQDSETGEALDKRIEANNRRIERCKEREAQLVQLFAQVSNIQTALQTTYLELVDLGKADPTTMLARDGGASQRLETAVEAARRVERKLRGLQDPAEKARDREYLRASDSEDPDKS